MTNEFILASNVKTHWIISLKQGRLCHVKPRNPRALPIIETTASLKHGIRHTSKIDVRQKRVIDYWWNNPHVKRAWVSDSRGSFIVEAHRYTLHHDSMIIPVVSCEAGGVALDCTTWRLYATSQTSNNTLYTHVKRVCDVQCIVAHHVMLVDGSCVAWKDVTPKMRPVYVQFTL